MPRKQDVDVSAAALRKRAERAHRRAADPNTYLAQQADEARAYRAWKKALLDPADTEAVGGVIDCSECDRLFTRWSDLDRHRCRPDCSAGEIAVVRALNSMGLAYAHDQTHPGLSEYAENRCLRFDFVVMLPVTTISTDGVDTADSGTVEVVIEVDGEQHSRSVRFGGMTHEVAAEEHARLCKHDVIKDSFCQDTGTPILRLSVGEALGGCYRLYEFLDVHRFRHATPGPPDLS